MRKSFFVIITALFVLCICSSAMAVTINVSGYATADNFLWVYSGTSWTALDLAESPGWRSSHQITTDGTSGNLYFAVQNLVDTQYPEGTDNPAAFLGSLTIQDGTFVETGTNTLLSDTDHWDIYSDLSWISGPSIDPKTISSWGSPTSYGKNNASNIWFNANGGPISNIDPNAEWIWTENNAKVGMDNFAILKTNYTVAPVPEPATMAMLGMGILGLFGLRKKV